MTEILDDIREKRNEKKTFSYLSAAFASLSVISVLMVWDVIPRKIRASESLETPNLGNEFAIAAIASCVLGLIFAIISFKQKEQSNFFKWLGLIISSIIVLMILASITFNILIDNDFI